ncbi:MAG: molybdopterin-synthase adenylyltransferase MoeB [Pseudomonadota bacterium]|nr:molybdopterin-synthase adenylyltransferase MoeB [Pseudomonadota bacterium]
MTFNEDQINRYARHILLPEIGGTGQEKLLNSRVLVIGAGGIGSPLLLYLAAAGIGTLGVIDDDTVDLSNLQRQIVHSTNTIDMPKVESAAQSIAAINPDVTFLPINDRIGPKNALKLFSDYDIIADGSDNFTTRFLVNDASYLAKKTLVSAAILRFDAQIYTFKAFKNGENNTHGPCYRCIFPTPPPDGQIPSCSEAGVLGAICGMAGSLQAVEVIKEILEIGESLSGSLLIYDGLTTTFRKIGIKPDPSCQLCGEKPFINNLESN